MELTNILRAAAVLVLLSAPLCGQSVTVRDGTGQLVTVTAPVTRVASLVASSIDMMVSLGAADRVVARTRYDTATAVAKAANLGGGIDPSVEVLIASRPDLLIAWKGQATTPAASRMRALGVPVYLVETKDTTALFATLQNLGALLGIAPRASTAANRLRAELQVVQRAVASRPRVKAVYIVSRSPVIVAAAGSYMAQLIGVAGADNPFADVAGDFPTLSLEAFLARDPDVLIVGRRGGGVRQLDLLRGAPGWRDLRAVRSGAVIEVDGEQWGRPTLLVGALVRSLAAELQRITPSAQRVRE